MSESQPTLFDDEHTGAPEDRQPGAIRPHPQRPIVDKRQRTFNRLLARVESLRIRRDAEKRRLDDLLAFHASHVAPRVRELLELRIQIVRSLRSFLLDKRLTSGDRALLHQIASDQVEWILAHDMSPPADICELFEQIHGVKVSDLAQDQLDAARAGFADFAAEMGLDLDVPELRVGMTDEELAASAAQFADQMQRAAEESANREQRSARRISKREAREQERIRRLEDARRNSIGVIYRRLVKALHPDREPDPAARERKVAIMQRVTTAHAANDLHTLLSLEIEFLHAESADVTRLAAETVEAYAQMLKQQAAELESECFELRLHPKYQTILVEDVLGMPRVIDGPAEVERLDFALSELRRATSLLTGANAIDHVRSLVREARAARRHDESARAGGRRRHRRPRRRPR
jgi:hypothetical protein